MRSFGGMILTVETEGDLLRRKTCFSATLLAPASKLPGEELSLVLRGDRRATSHGTTIVIVFTTIYLATFLGHTVAAIQCLQYVPQAMLLLMLTLYRALVQ
jgi:hypothetical protein